MSNSFGELDYTMALKVLKRIQVRKHHGIVILRNVAGKEIIPASVRPVPEDLSGENSGEKEASDFSVPDDTGTYIPASDNELTKNSLCQCKALFAGLFSHRLASPTLSTMQNDWIFRGCCYL